MGHSGQSFSQRLEVFESQSYLAFVVVGATSVRPDATTDVNLIGGSFTEGGVGVAGLRRGRGVARYVKTADG